MEPEHIDGRAKVHHLELCGVTHSGVSSIAGDNKVGLDIDFSGRGLDLNAVHSSICFQKARDGMSHAQIEGREAFSMFSQKIQKIPLWHQRNEFALNGKMGKIGCCKREISK